MAKLSSELIVYQTKSGALELRVDSENQTFKLTQQQVADIFNVQKSAISKHVKNIFKSGELSKKATVSILETVQVEDKRKVKRSIELYNLDLVLSIGYRVNSIEATKFRQWSTKILKNYMIDGYAINKKRIASNYTNFQNAVENVRKLLPANTLFDAHSAIELIKMFADTWLNLDAYDKSSLPKAGITRKQVEVTAKELSNAISQLMIFPPFY